MKNLSIKGVLATSALLFIFAAAPSYAAMGDADEESVAENLQAARTLIEKNDFRGAIPLLLEVVDTDDRNANAFNYLGYSYRRLKNFPLALKNYRRALEIEPNHKGANEYIGETYIELGRPDDAKDHLARLKSICGLGCEEYRELKEALDGYFKQRARRKGSAAR